MNTEAKDCDQKKIKDGKIKNVIKINPPLKERLSLKQYFQMKEDFENGDFEEFDDFQKLLEALSVSTRIKKGTDMKRHEVSLQIARKKVLARHAEKKRLEKRGRRDAVDKIKRKYSAGQNPDDLSYGDKARIEDILKTKKGAIAALSRRMINKARERENARHNKKNKGDK